MNQLYELKRCLELSEYVQFTDSKGQFLHTIKSEKLLLLFSDYEKLQKRFDEAVECIKKASEYINMDDVNGEAGSICFNFLRSFDKVK